MTALAGSGVAVTNPVANSAAAANPIGSFMVKSSIWDSSNMQARPVAGKGAKGHRTIHSYTTALYRLLATRRCLTAYARARGAEPGCQARARRARGAHAGGGALRPEPDDLAPQPLNLQLLRLHLPLAGNACRGSAANSLTLCTAFSCTSRSHAACGARSYSHRWRSRRLARGAGRVISPRNNCTVTFRGVRRPAAAC
jgi:hypothetical protein